MKKLLALAAILFTAPSYAQSAPFVYETTCALEHQKQFLKDTCKVIETRESTGALRSRNVFSNKFGLTVKLRWNGEKFVTWDSHNKFEYEWEYKRDQVDGLGIWTKIMPSFYLENVSWD